MTFTGFPQSFGFSNLKWCQLGFTAKADATGLCPGPGRPPSLAIYGSGDLREGRTSLIYR